MFSVTPAAVLMAIGLLFSDKVYLGAGIIYMTIGLGLTMTAWPRG